MEQNRRPVASLWIGEKLHYLNQLCLKSHLRHGHPVTLYCTDTVTNAPEGVELRPATDIMEISSARVKETSASFWSNVFRYKMIEKTDAIWIDCDAFCHKPFPDDWAFIFAGHGLRGALNCGVVGIPKESALLAQLIDYYDNLPDYPPWWNAQQRKKLDALSDELPHSTRIYKTERTAFGPQAFTHFAKVTGDFEKAMGSDVLYPVPFQLNDVFYDPFGRVEGWFSDGTVSVHLYTNGTKPWWQNHPPLANSYAARMCAEVGIDASRSLKGKDCDIDPQTPDQTVSPVATPKRDAEDIEAKARIKDLEKSLQKQERRAKRNMRTAWADGFLEGVCGLLKAGDIAIDLGANAGEISEQLLATGAEVIAFDPEPWALEKIVERLGEHPNYTFYNVAVGVQDRTVQMFRASNFDKNEKSASVKTTVIAGGRMIAEEKEKAIDVQQIDFISFLKSLIADRGDIAFLKMDIEGAELDILEAMDRENLFDHIRCTVVETHERKFKDLRPRYRELRARFADKYSAAHVSLDWK